MTTPPGSTALPCRSALVCSLLQPCSSWSSGRPPARRRFDPERAPGRKHPGPSPPSRIPSRSSGSPLTKISVSGDCQDRGQGTGVLPGRILVSHAFGLQVVAAPAISIRIRRELRSAFTRNSGSRVWVRSSSSYRETCGAHIAHQEVVDRLDAVLPKQHRADGVRDPDAAEEHMDPPGTPAPFAGLGRFLQHGALGPVGQSADCTGVRVPA